MVFRVQILTLLHEAGRFSEKMIVSQLVKKFPHPSCTPSIPICPPLDHILSHLNLPHTRYPTSKTHFNIIIPFPSYFLTVLHLAFNSYFIRAP
jgi:hypothetical protein